MCQAGKANSQGVTPDIADTSETAGNGGRIVMGIPDLDLVIAFYGCNYSDAVMYRAQNVLIPEYILKSVH